MMTRKFTPQAEWEDERQKLGLAGEQEALAWFTANGWSIEAHRFKLGRYDLDLVVRKGSQVAFVEVKTRRTDTFGTPLEAVGRQKRERLGRVAALWCLRFGRPGDSYRFDLVGVTPTRSGGMVVEHVPDAWRLGEW